MIRIDLGMLFSAMSHHEPETGEKAFLNRNTGEIVFTYDDEIATEDDQGPAVAASVSADRERVPESPIEWLEIPRRDPWIEGKDNEDDFAKKFLRQNQIDAEFV